MEGEVLRVDPNTADLDTLRQLPGVGPALGQRIIEARPFHNLDDLRRVPGLGEAALAGLEPHLDFAEEPAAMVDASAAEAREGTSESPAVAEPGVQPSATPSPARTVTRPEALRIAGAAATVSILLSVLLTLMILAGINGSLDAGRNRTVRQMRSQVEQASAVIESVTANLESIDGRLQALEGLTGRMTAVEGQVSGMRADIDEALTQVGAMQSALADVQSGMQELGGRVGQFDLFLDGLRELLVGTAAAPEVEPSPVP